MSALYSILIADPIHAEGRALLASDSRFRIDVETGLDEAALTARIPDMLSREKRSAKWKSKERVRFPYSEFARERYDEAVRALRTRSACRALLCAFDCPFFADSLGRHRPCHFNHCQSNDRR
jgi:hypothetical protein